MSKTEAETKTTKTPKPVSLSDEDLKALRLAMSEDLGLFGVLHAKELDENALGELQGVPFSQRLGVVLSSKRAQEALCVMDGALSGEAGPELDRAQLLDELACDYAGIYLTHQCSVSPNESPWRDEDKLDRQQPMFEVRDWYHRHDMAAKDWRVRPDDHLATQLAFAAHLMANEEIDLTETAHFLDQHLFLWVGSFCERVAGRCATPFYAGLSMLTFSYLEELRDMIEALTGLARPLPEEEDREKEMAAQREELDSAFAPGLGGPGW